jgi:hypothetical protein
MIIKEIGDLSDTVFRTGLSSVRQLRKEIGFDSQTVTRLDLTVFES